MWYRWIGHATVKAGVGIGNSPTNLIHELSAATNLALDSRQCRRAIMPLGAS